MEGERKQLHGQTIPVASFVGHESLGTIQPSLPIVQRPTRALDSSALEAPAKLSSPSWLTFGQKIRTFTRICRSRAFLEKSDFLHKDKFRGEGDLVYVVKNTHMLFKASSIVFINEDQTEIIPHAKHVVDFPESRCKLEAAEEQSYRYCLSCGREYEHASRNTRKETCLARAYHP